MDLQIFFHDIIKAVADHSGSKVELTDNVKLGGVGYRSSVNWLVSWVQDGKTANLLFSIPTAELNASIPNLPPVQRAIVEIAMISPLGRSIFTHMLQRAGDLIRESNLKNPKPF